MCRELWRALTRRSKASAGPDSDANGLSGQAFLAPTKSLTRYFISHPPTWQNQYEAIKAPSADNYMVLTQRFISEHTMGDSEWVIGRCAFSRSPLLVEHAFPTICIAYFRRHGIIDGGIRGPQILSLKVMIQILFSLQPFGMSEF